MRRALTVVAIALLVAAAAFWIIVPPASRATAPPPAHVVRGVYHVHTTRSDGSGSPDEVAAAAAQAGLQFVIITDHGDGTRVPDPPSYRSGVLTIDAVELNTTGGHYVALGLPPSPYPLAGTPHAVIEDVKRLGGVGIAAHPGSPRASLRWTDWSADVDGVEWLNGDSEWRDEPRLPIVRSLMSYFLRGPESMGVLLDRPAVIDQWDQLSQSRRVFTIAGLDAHAWLGYERDPETTGVHLPIPGYEVTFRAFSNHVMLDVPLTGDAAADARALLEAITRGRLYSVIDALASPGGLSFTATSGARTVSVGDELSVDGDVQLRATVMAPRGTTIVLIKNGERVHEVTDALLEMNGGTDQAVYRVEAFVSRAPGEPPVPWIVSNPIYVGFTRQQPEVVRDEPPAYRIPARSEEAAVEHGATDASALGPPPRDPLGRRPVGDAPLVWSFALSGGAPRGQFAAVRVPITAGLAAFDRVRFRVTSSLPLRAWVQLRSPAGNMERWGTTFYADGTERVVDLPLRSFMPIGETSSQQPPLERVDSLLFVVDTLNFRPGATGSMTISEIAYVR